MKIAIVLMFSLALLTPLATSSQSVQTATYRIPTSMDDGWKTSNAEALGVDSKQLAALTQSIRNWPELGVHAILVERRGQLIYEEYFDGFDERWGQQLDTLGARILREHILQAVRRGVTSGCPGA